MIRNFIYLDSEKLRSLSSQLFEGVTEYILKGETQAKQREDSQKGPVGSGQLLADIFRREGSSTELRFLEDHAYVLFEERLLQEGQIDLVMCDEGGPTAFGKPFVRVTSPLTLNDVREVLNLVDNFNEFGEALYRVINQAEISTGNKGKPLSDSDVRARARQQDMQMDPKFAQALNTTLSFGYQELIEAQMSVGSQLFSAPLKRTSLRETEEMLVQKFSRQSQCEFTMLGIITQHGSSEEIPIPTVVPDASNLKEAMQFIVGQMRALEGTFTGPIADEIVVDPVAIYMSV